MNDAIDDLNRRRIEELNRDAEQSWQGRPTMGPCAMVRTVANGHYPAVVNAFFCCEVVKVSGELAEGSPVTYTGTGQFLYAANIGSQVPPEGTYHVATAIEGCWTIKHGC